MTKIHRQNIHITRLFLTIFSLEPDGGIASTVFVVLVSAQVGESAGTGRWITDLAGLLFGASTIPVDDVDQVPGIFAKLELKLALFADGAPRLG